MSERNSAIVGSVFERKPSLTPTAPQVFTSGKTGFPVVQHRSKSAFARSRGNSSSPRLKDVPTITQTDRKTKAVDLEEWRKQMSRENQQRVEGMTEEEREAERQEIVARFGAGVGDLLKRVQLAKVQEAAKTDQGLLADHIQSAANGERSLDEGTSICSLHTLYHSL
jgi:RNA polymerase II-associated protein 1